MWIGWREAGGTADFLGYWPVAIARCSDRDSCGFAVSTKLRIMAFPPTVTQLRGPGRWICRSCQDIRGGNQGMAQGGECPSLWQALHPRLLLLVWEQVLGRHELVDLH